MGGFANLKNDFDQWFKTLDPFVNGGQGQKNVDKQQQDVFRFLYLRCLFEIAGNLDTIALCSRAFVEQLERLRITEEERTQILAASITKDEDIAGLHEMIKAIQVRLSDPPRKKTK